MEFSFCKYRREFESVLPKNKLINDLSDFWKFVAKYESVLQRSGQTILMHLKSKYDAKFQKSFYSCFLFKIDKIKSINKILCDNNIKQFYEIIKLYFDFKQKERFDRLKKLRDSQKSLPIFKFKDKIREELQEHQVIIIAGDTGCGKSTQVPQFLYEYGYRGIVCTQPRRLACISLSKRVAYETLNTYNNRVGYQIRFESSKTKKTEIVFMTEGLLLRQFSLDGCFDDYNIIILDEIHERNLYGDFLLGITKCLLKSKPFLKLILMSATINIPLFQEYFSDENVQLIEVPGRCYPIKMIYQPPQLKAIEKIISYNRYNPHVESSRREQEKFDAEPYLKILSSIMKKSLISQFNLIIILDLIDNKYTETEKGDVLIFVSGVREIDNLIEAAKSTELKSNKWVFLPLHSGLSLEEQDNIFLLHPVGTRKCIVSTNIAETSITLSGIRFVIDSGRMKEMNYDSLSKTECLKEFSVSKSSANQRSGRAGRTGPGICYRLYSEKDYEGFQDYPTPEIRRVPLENVLLQMIAMGLQNVRIFPFIESPSLETIEQSIAVLKKQDALTELEKITTLGKTLSALPVELSIGKILLMGLAVYNIEKIITLAAVLSIQTIFTNRAFTDNQCRDARQHLESEHSDIFTTLNCYKFWLEEKAGRQNTRQMCRKMGIEEQRFYEITKIRKQFKVILENSKLILQNISEKSMSSADRRIRQGELRLLKGIKRSSHLKTLEQEQKRFKHERSDDPNEDIRDVNFRLSKDFTVLNDIIRSAEVRNSEVILIKLFMISGLYPNIAVPDEFNYCKTESQQFFHTASKLFVLIHPNSQLCFQLDSLKLRENQIYKNKPEYYANKLPLSSDHKIFCYQSLLETTKSYLINPFHLPAAISLFLFANSIDTNMSANKIVCDSWLCLEFPIECSGQELLKKMLNIRENWLHLLNHRLDPINNPANSNSCWNDIMEQINNCLQMKCFYTMKRLLPADVKKLYTYKSIEPEVFTQNPFSDTFEMFSDEKKGGIRVTTNVTFGCLQEEMWTLELDKTLEDQDWFCNNCQKNVSLCGIMKLVHSSGCKKKVLKSDDIK